MKLMRLSLICLLALTLLLSGCVSSDVREYTGADISVSGTASDSDLVENTVETESADMDYTYVYEKYDPDTLVMTIDGLEVCWQEYFYWVVSELANIEYNYGPVTDWQAACAMDSAKTNEQYLADYALELLMQYRALESNSAAIGAQLDAEDEAYVQETWDQYVEYYAQGDETVFREEFLETMYMDEAFFNSLSELDCLYYAAFEQMYGENGSLLSDEEALEYAEQAGYMAAKHILVMTVNPDTGEVLPEEEIAEKKALAEELLAEIHAAEDQNAKFDQLMMEYSEDTGLLYYPEGYIFAEGEMVEAFESTTKALAEGEISGVVESDYGCHIIMRLPLDPDQTVDYYGEDDQTTLRYMAAMTRYDSTVTNWGLEAEVVWAPEFEAQDLAALFAR